MSKTRFVTSLVWLALALAVCAEGWSIKIGSLRMPGPGFMPFWAGVLLAGLSLIALIQGIRPKGGAAPAPAFAGVQWGPLAILLGALFLYAFLLNHLGFILATFPLLLLLFRLVEAFSWPRVLLLSLLTLAGTYLVFIVLLESRLPKGPLGF